MNNTGTVQVQTGTLNLAGGGTSSGAFTVSAGATLGFTGGTHNFGGATFTNANIINLSGATVTFNAPTTIPGTVNFSSGTLNGTATVTFSGPLSWTSGTMSGTSTAQTTLANGGISFSGIGNTYLDNRTLRTSARPRLPPATTCTAETALFSTTNWVPCWICKAPTGWLTT